MSTKCLFTFDDGPHPTITPAVLAALSEAQISAVFFVVGSRLATPYGKDLGMQIIAEGHLLGNHTFTHVRLTGRREEEVRGEVLRTEELIAECGEDRRLFRPPYGAHDGKVDHILRELGYDTLLWNVDSLDWKLRSKNTWVPHTIAQIGARDRETILLHDIHRSTVAGLTGLVEALKSEHLVEFASASEWQDFILAP
jgi:peptidoglycan-N-acetylglucosamine deacetylase